MMITAWNYFTFIYFIFHWLQWDTIFIACIICDFLSLSFLKGEETAGFGRTKDDFFWGCIESRLSRYKDGHILFCELIELPWLKQFIVFIGVNDSIWLNHWDGLKAEILIYSYLTAVVCLELFLVLIFLFLVLLKERKTLIFSSVSSSLAF